MPVAIRATPVKGRDLRPGDLFSTRGQDYWDGIEQRRSVGESVYIRTSTPADRFPDADEEVFRIEIAADGGECLGEIARLARELVRRGHDETWQCGVFLGGECTCGLAQLQNALKP